MSTTEERLRVLKMLEDGKISAEEATQLLQAITSGGKGAGSGRASSGREPRWLRVRITDTTTGQNKVSVNLPMGLVRTGIKMGARFVPTDSEVDYDEIIAAIEGGETGKIIEIVDEEQGERVEIYAE